MIVMGANAPVFLCVIPANTTVIPTTVGISASSSKTEEIPACAGMTINCFRNLFLLHFVCKNPSDTGKNKKCSNSCCCPPSPLIVNRCFLFLGDATARHSIFLNKKPPFGGFLLIKIGGGPGRT